MIRKKFNSHIALILFLFCFLVLTGNKVYASDKFLEVPLKVKQSFEVHKHSQKEIDLTGTYELHRLSESNEDNNQDIFAFSMDGDKDEFTIPLRYSHAGIYRYELQQTTENKDNYSFDRSTYIVTVYVKNNESNQIIPQVIVENSNGEKCGEIAFCNCYSEKEQAPSSSKNNHLIKTGDQTNIEIWYFTGASALITIVLLASFKRRMHK